MVVDSLLLSGNTTVDVDTTGCDDVVADGNDDVVADGNDDVVADGNDDTGNGTDVSIATAPVAVFADGVFSTCTTSLSVRNPRPHISQHTAT